MPADRLALAILVRCEQELVRTLQLLPQRRDYPLLVRVDDVVRLEPVVDRDSERAVPLPLLLRDLGRALRQVPDVADARLDHELWAQIARDRFRLCRRLDDDQLPCHGRTR